MLPRILLSQILVNLPSRYPQRPLHITTIVISVLNLAPCVYDVVLVSGVTIPVIVTTVLY